MGAGEIVLNCIDRDGMMNGYDLNLIDKAREKIFKEFSLTQESSMARNILNHASLASRELKRDLAESD